MPELPEVETTRRGLVPQLVGLRLRGAVVRERRLRWPVPRDLDARVRGEELLGIRRRGKYLLFDCRKGHLLVHLGMSGRLTMVPEDRPHSAHDHVDLRFAGRRTLRLTDPRRFGAMLWIRGPVEKHRLLAGLGLEPLEEGFDGAALAARARGRRVAVKPFLTNARIVTGIGNIYASEALFRARIDPRRSVQRIGAREWERLAGAVRETLERALAAGGTTLRDYAAADGRPGWYQDERAVYDRAGEPCRACGTPIVSFRQANRSTFHCPSCQR
jgi:formamidopyrimidine-DNA glycosylase